MYNYFMLVGRVVESPVEKTDNGKERVEIKLSVRRQFPNGSGEYKSDEFSISLWGGFFNMALEQMKVGQTVMIKGRAEVCSGKIELIGERVMFFQGDPA